MTDLPVRARHDSGGCPVVRVTDVSEDLSGLEAEFPGYEFATQQTWDGISISARRRRAAHGQGSTPLSPATRTRCAARSRRMSEPAVRGDSQRQP